MSHSEEQLIDELHALGSQDPAHGDSFPAEQFSKSVVKTARNRKHRNRYAVASIGVTAALLLVNQWQTNPAQQENSLAKAAIAEAVDQTTETVIDTKPEVRVVDQTQILMAEIQILQQRLALLEHTERMSTIESYNQQKLDDIDNQLYAQHRLQALKQIDLTKYSNIQ